MKQTVSLVWSFENCSEPARESKPTLPLVASTGWRLFYSDLSSATVRPAEFLWKHKRRGRKPTGCNFLGICIFLGGKKLRAKCGQLGSKQKAQSSCSSAYKRRKEERKEEFVLLLWSQMEVFRCSTWRALGKVSEMAGTVRTSATTDGGFHSATFSYIRGDECVRYRGRLHGGEEGEFPCQQQWMVRWAQQPPTEFLPWLQSPREMQMPVCLQQSRLSLRTSLVCWRAIWESVKLSRNQEQISLRIREWPTHSHGNYT